MKLLDGHGHHGHHGHGIFMAHSSHRHKPPWKLRDLSGPCQWCWNWRHHINESPPNLKNGHVIVVNTSEYIVTTLQIKTVSGRVGVDTYWRCWNVRINAIANISCNTNNKIMRYNIAKRSSQILNRSVCILELGSPAYSLEVLHRSNEEACNTRTVISPTRLSWSPFWGKLSNSVHLVHFKNLPCNFESRIEYNVSMFTSVVAVLTGSAASIKFSSAKWPSQYTLKH